MAQNETFKRALEETPPQTDNEGGATSSDPGKPPEDRPKEPSR